MKKLKTILPKQSGRVRGRVTVRHQGGREKRYLRLIDTKRDKKDVWGKVIAVEYDPNRNAELALVLYEDGERRYILAPDTLKVGMKVISSEVAPIEAGNALTLKVIPVGTQIHNIEIARGKGGQMVKGAGTAAVVFGKEDTWVLVKLPSGEIRRFDPECKACIGQVGNVDARNRPSVGDPSGHGIQRQPLLYPVLYHLHNSPHAFPLFDGARAVESCEIKINGIQSIPNSAGWTGCPLPLYAIRTIRDVDH